MPLEITPPQDPREVEERPSLQEEDNYSANPGRKTTVGKGLTLGLWRGERKSILHWIGRKILPDSTPHEFQAEAVEIAHSPASPIGRMISWSIMAACLIAFLWSVLGELDVVVTARGRIIPSDKTNIVQAPEVALVSSIDVQEGMSVKQGDLLIKLNPTEAIADRSRLRTDLAETRIAQARLRALLTSPKDPERAAELFAPPQGAAQEAIERHRHQLMSVVSENRSKLLGLAAEREQKLAEMASSKAEIEQIEVQLPFMHEQAAAKRQLASTGSVARLTLSEVEQRLAGVEGEAKILRSKLIGTEAAIQRLDYAILQSQAELTRATLTELNDLETRAAALEQELIKAEYRAQRLNVVAPISGYVQQISVNTLGSTVQLGQQLLVIVPEGSSLDVEARIENKDIGDIRIGQRVEVKIDTFDFTKYGLVGGTIRTLSRDAVAPAEAAPGVPSAQQVLEPVYLARVTLDRPFLGRADAPMTFSPGMGTTVEVKVGRRRVIDYFLSPILEHVHTSLRDR